MTLGYLRKTNDTVSYSREPLGSSNPHPPQTGNGALECELRGFKIYHKSAKKVRQSQREAASSAAGGTVLSIASLGCIT